MINVPESVLVNTGYSQPVYAQIDDFFNEIQNVLEPKPMYRPSLCEVRVNHLRKDRVELDDGVHLFLYRQRVVANVVETRNDFNHVRFDFFLADLEKVLRDFREIELKERELFLKE